MDACVLLTCCMQKQDNIFLNFDASDPLLALARLGFGITLLCAVPMMVVPCRYTHIHVIHTNASIRPYMHLVASTQRIIPAC
jgi:hypothetical protein